MKGEAKENLGGAPTHIGEFGISFDLRKGKAFRGGDFRLAARAVDRTFRALEDNLLSATLWDYTADNTNAAKDIMDYYRLTFAQLKNKLELFNSKQEITENV